jgi:membrane-associated protease RseP (regulator of RpoE activity)
MSTMNDSADTNFHDDSQRMTRLVGDLFEVGAVYRQGEASLSFSLSYRFNRAKSRKLLRDRLETAGYDFTLDKNPDGLVLVIDPRPRRHIPALNIVLFVATLLSVYIVSILSRWLSLTGDFGYSWEMTWAALGRGEGLVFTVAMISIVFVHEMGHYVLSRKRHIITTWPYFIPAPNIIGTFGAVIKSKSPFWNRSDLIAVGAAGPIAGWIIAVGWLWFGLSQTTILPLEALPPAVMGHQLYGESILMQLSTLLLVGEAPPGRYYYLTEAAFAGWVGMLITAINMLPIGQLDGGHVIYGLLRRHQHRLGKIAVAALVLLGFQSFMWWIFAALGLVFGMSHPPTLDDNVPLDRTALWMGWIAVAILVVSFTPIPFQ